MIVDVYTTVTVLQKTQLKAIPKNILLFDKEFKLEGLVLYKPPARKTRGSKSANEEEIVLNHKIGHYTAAILHPNGQWSEIDDLSTSENPLASKSIVPHLIIYSLM